MCVATGIAQWFYRIIITEAAVWLLTMYSKQSKLDCGKAKEWGWCEGDVLVQVLSCLSTNDQSEWVNVRVFTWLEHPVLHFQRQSCCCQTMRLFWMQHLPPNNWSRGPQCYTGECRKLYAWGKSHTNYFKDILLYWTLCYNYNQIFFR